MAIAFFRHDLCREHDTGPGHPERPQRLAAIERRLADAGWPRLEVVEAPAADEQQLLRVHSAAHLERVRRHVAAGVPLDLDTPVSPRSLDAALVAAGAACALAEALLTGRYERGFAAVRPPGHHAEPERAMGFCLFNNVACAAAHAFALGAERVAVVDFDVHHGNGTCEAFRRSDRLLFASIHQWPFYPGTGALEDVGSGPGRGYTINLPVPVGSDGDDWLSLIAHVVVPALRRFAPDLILVSAGYDAHRADPIGGCLLETEDYAEITRHLDLVARALGVPLGFVLEGGYDLTALAESVLATIFALGEPAEVTQPQRSPLVERALAVLGGAVPLLES